MYVLSGGGIDSSRGLADITFTTWWDFNSKKFSDKNLNETVNVIMSTFT